MKAMLIWVARGQCPPGQRLEYRARPQPVSSPVGSRPQLDRGDLLLNGSQ